MVAHDLRQPVALLLGAARMLGSDRDTGGDIGGDTDRDRLLDIIVRSAERIDAMVQDLAVASRPDFRSLPLQREPIDLDAFCRELAGDAGADVTVRVDHHGTPVWADRRNLERMVSNLLENAIRHGAPPIELCGTVEPGRLVVSVIDHGPPIGPDSESLFERFVTGTGPGSGSGLGLHIVRRMAQAHGGTVGVVRGYDTNEFRIELPQRDR